MYWKAPSSFHSVLAGTLCILFILCTAPGNSLAQGKRPITHEDVWLMKRVGAPVPSPDGKWIVFTVTEPAYDEKDQVSDLWIVPADGSAKPRRLTNTKGGESGAAWSPDSQQIVFAAKREGDEVAQVYLLNVVNGGEAIRVTSLSTGARAPLISPDGRRLLFTSSVYPGAMTDEENKKIAAERKARKYNARVYDGFPVRNWDKWLDEKQSHLFVQMLEQGAKAKDLLAGSKLVNEPGYSGATSAGGDELQAVWAPDSDSVIFVAMTSRHTAAYAETYTSLYQAAVNGGEPKLLTRNDGSYTSPKFSPDGKSLYSLFEAKTNFVYNISRLTKFTWPAVENRLIVTENHGNSINSFTFSPNDNNIYFSSEFSGREMIYSVAASGGAVSIIKGLGNGCYTNLAATRTGLFANFENAVSPLKIVRVRQGTHDRDLEVDLNAERTTVIDLPPLREFTFNSKRGRQIHSFLALPPNFDENKKYPLFVVIHGGPHSMWRDQFVLRWNYHLLAAPGYVVLLTNYTGSTGFGEKFAQNIQLDPLAGPADEINEAADEAIKRFRFIDATQQAAGGASYGGHLANWLQASTTRYKCLISHAGLVNLESQWGTSDTIYSRELNNGGPVWEQGEVWRKQNPIRYAANFKTPMLITVGENDFRVPLNNSLENWSVHQRLKVPSRLIVFPEENHWVLKGENSRFFYGEVHAWLKKWLNNGTQN